MAESGYEDIPGVMRVPKGLHLSESSKTEGGFSSLARDENNALKDHGVFIPADDDDDSEDESSSLFERLSAKEMAVIGLAIGAAAALGYGIASGVQYLKNLSIEKKKVKEAQATAEVELDEPSDKIATAEEPVTTLIGTEFELSDVQPSITMSADEWQDLLRKLVMLNSLEERIWILLSNARIEDGSENMLEWQQRMKAFSQQEAANQIRLMLEAHPQLQDKKEVAELIKAFINGRPDQGHDQLDRIEAK
ncbi:hypothetical protein [Mycetocola saprophilus]|uniref:hypothetical protein n=1 Tax=Mycetocola saprophilus TaxID=76636 RepID=UPI003BF0C004